MRRKGLFWFIVLNGVRWRGKRVGYGCFILNIRYVVEGCGIGEIFIIWLIRK